jgi:hypothetical protein
MTASFEIGLSSLFIRIGRFEVYASRLPFDLGAETGIKPGEITFRVLGFTVYLTNHHRFESH